MRLRVASGMAGFGVLILIAGCDGGSERRFTLADAARIVDVRPAAPGWKWPSKHAKSVSTDSTPPTSTDPIIVAFEKRTRGLVDLGDAVSHWQDNDKLAHLDISVYRDAADAHRSMAPFNAFSRAFGKRTGHVRIDAKVDGLGDDAWLLWVALSNGDEATYHWRRGNMVIEAHIQCFGSCPPGTVAAAREWVAAIDARARASRSR